MLYDLTECNSVIRRDGTIPYNIFCNVFPPEENYANLCYSFPAGSWYIFFLLQINLREANAQVKKAKFSISFH